MSETTFVGLERRGGRGHLDPRINTLLGPFKKILPARVREGIGFATIHAAAAHRHPWSIFLESLAPGGLVALRASLTGYYLSLAGFPQLKLDGRTDPGAVKEILVDREYDLEGFVPGAGWTVLDIGARHGEFSLLASAVRGANVLAFEPMSENIEILRANLALNHPCQVSVFPFALGDRNRVVTGRIYSGMFSSPRLDSPLRSATIQMRALDDLVSSIQAVSGEVLVKIDVEGFEIDVLKGSERFLRRAKPRLVVEVDSQTRRAVYDYCLNSLGFQLVLERPKPQSSLLFFSPGNRDSAT